MNTNLENMSYCNHFDSCNQNLCVLDYDLHLRVGRKADKCRYMREPKAVTINGRHFISGGTAMPTASLNFVPSANLRWLNAASKTKLFKLSSSSP